MVSFFDRLREERSRLGISQTAFGEIAGVTKKTQSLYESGERAPDARYLEKVATVGVDVQYVITGERKHGSQPMVTWADVEQAGHGWLSDAVMLEAIKIDSRQTYDFLLGLLMRNLTKVTGVTAPDAGKNSGSAGVKAV